MPDGYLSLILYHPSDQDLSQALLRCRDLIAFVCQALYPGADPTGYKPDLALSFEDPPATLLWWLCSLQVTLDSLYTHAIARPSDPLATALQAYLSQHPEQAPQLRRVLVEANERDFTKWDQVRTVIAAAPSPSAERQCIGFSNAILALALPERNPQNAPWHTPAAARWPSSSPRATMG